MVQSRHTYTVYMAGPITGCNDDQKKRWRREFVDAVGRLRNDVEYYDPTEWSTDWRPLRETLQLRSVDVVVANMWKESVGTTVGIMQAIDVGKPVILIDPCYLNSKILSGLIGSEPARSIEEAAERLDAVLDGIKELVVLKTTGEQAPFELTKLVASIQTACGAAHVPEDLFAQQVSARVLQSLQASARGGQPVLTTQIRDTIFSVLEDLSVNPVFDAEVRRDAAAVMKAWKKKEGYKAADEGMEKLRVELLAARTDAEMYREFWMAASKSREAKAQAQPEDSFAQSARLPMHASLSDAAASAEQKWQDALLVLPSAHKSARSYSKWRDGDRAFRLLDLLGQCAFERMVDRAERRVGPTIDQWLEQRQDGFEVARTESKETMDRYAKDRTFSGPGGRQWVCKKHLKVGAHGGAEKVLRIYFCEDPDTGRIVIGHVGEHLRTYAGKS